MGDASYVCVWGAGYTSLAHAASKVGEEEEEEDGDGGERVAEGASTRLPHAAGHASVIVCQYLAHKELPAPRHASPTLRGGGGRRCERLSTEEG